MNTKGNDWCGVYMKEYRVRDRGREREDGTLKDTRVGEGCVRSD